MRVLDFSSVPAVYQFVAINSGTARALHPHRDLGKAMSIVKSRFSSSKTIQEAMWRSMTSISQLTSDPTPDVRRDDRRDLGLVRALAFLQRVQDVKFAEQSGSQHLRSKVDHLSEDEYEDKSLAIHRIHSYQERPRPALPVLRVFADSQVGSSGN